jgi:hypothetical protein
VAGNLRWVDGDSVPAASLTLGGTVHFEPSLGASGLFVSFAPLEWGALADIVPRWTLRGPGAAHLEAFGNLADGLRIDLEATHVPVGRTPSRVTTQGMIRRYPAGLFLDLAADLRPLSLSGLGRDLPSLPLTGELSGPVEVRGYLTDLALSAELNTSAGTVLAEARLDVTRPEEGYFLDAQGEGLLLSEMIPALPTPTRVSGRVVASGQGFGLDSIRGEATAFVRNGEVGQLEVDSAALAFRIDGGLLYLEALFAETEVGTVEADGTFGVASSAPPGEVRLRVEAESLAGLQPYLMGGEVIAGDTLTRMEQDFLVIGGVDLDTLPTAASVAVEGRVQGRAVLRGGLKDFDADGALDFQGLTFRSDRLGSGRLTFSGQGVPTERRSFQATVRASSSSDRPVAAPGASSSAPTKRITGSGEPSPSIPWADGGWTSTS